jgi:cation diffusion facilitator CzcD-associated flavoprotein CzcO
MKHLYFPIVVCPSQSLIIIRGELMTGMIHQYFHDYATTFNLWDYITFNIRVERLYRREDNSWIIETREGEEEFDYVCVGNGHYEDGWIPDIPGLSYVVFRSVALGGRTKNEMN